MQLEVKKNLHDIMVSIESIEEFTLNIKNFSDFKSNKLVKRAVERELGIIGEAVNRIKKIDPDFTIENERKIIGLRNIVIHGYDKVDDAIVWGVIKKHLPVLKKQVLEII